MKTKAMKKAIKFNNNNFNNPVILNCKQLTAVQVKTN